MYLEVGAVLKICLSCSETLYFKVKKIETTALAVKQICTMKRDILTKEREDAPCSYVYKSELGVHYIEVDEEEKEWLRLKYKAAG
jgi:hypothetical protein